MKLLLFFPLLILVQFLSAQTFTELPQTPAFIKLIDTSIAFADVDGDNDEDFLIAGRDDSQNRHTRLYLNDGLGNYTEMLETPFVGVSDGSINFSDIDGDGDEDLLITGAGGFNGSIPYALLYTNDGLGNFTEVTETPLVGVTLSSAAFADVDGDDDLDILITGREPTYTTNSRLYKNDGLGNFTEVTGISIVGIQLGSIAFGDLDGDGDQDLIIMGTNLIFGQVTKLYFNDGLGNFSVVTTTLFDRMSNGSIGMSDIDGDDDQDILITGFGVNTGGIVRLYINDGLGNFTKSTTTPFIGNRGGSIAFADIDLDDDQDVLITGLSNSDISMSKLYTNDGAGNFTELIGTPFTGVTSSSIAFADVDGDNDKDVLITGSNTLYSGKTSKLFINDGLVSTNNNFFNTNFDFTLSPNPTTEDRIYINFNAIRASELTIKISSLEGRLLIQENNPSIIGEQSFSINISSLKKGSYFIELFDGKKRGVRKFIVQ